MVIRPPNPSSTCISMRLGWWLVRTLNKPNPKFRSSDRGAVGQTFCLPVRRLSSLPFGQLTVFADRGAGKRPSPAASKGCPTSLASSSLFMMTSLNLTWSYHANLRDKHNSKMYTITASRAYPPTNLPPTNLELTPLLFYKRR